MISSILIDKKQDYRVQNNLIPENARQVNQECNVVRTVHGPRGSGTIVSVCEIHDEFKHNRDKDEQDMNEMEKNEKLHRHRDFRLQNTFLPESMRIVNQECNMKRVVHGPRGSGIVMNICDTPDEFRHDLKLTKEMKEQLKRIEKFNRIE